MRKLMVIPSKENLQQRAQPITEITRNKNIRTLVIDRAIHDEFAAALRDPRVRLTFNLNAIEFTDHPSGVIIALDGNGEFCGAYKLPGTTHPVPAGQGI